MVDFLALFVMVLTRPEALAGVRAVAVSVLFNTHHGGSVQLPRRLVLLLLSLAFTSFSCQPEETGSVRFAVSVGQSFSSAASVTRVTVTSSGPGVPTVSTELVQTNGVWVGVISNISAGSARVFDARAFDSADTVLFTGSSVVTITANQTTLVALTLQESNPPPPFSNEAPIIQSVAASSTIIQLGGSITLQATAQDPNGDALAYAWTAPAGSFSSASGQSTAWAAPSTTGVVNLTITVSDSQGAASSVTIAVNVVSSSSGEGSAVLDVRFNSWPVVAVLSAAPTQLDVGQSVTVTVTATDGDEDSLSFQWASTCAGSWTNSTSRTASFSPSAIPSGACNNCQLSVTVADGRGGQTSGTVAICVAATNTNRFPPTIIRSYQSSLTASPGQLLTFEIVASDPQNSSLTFAWEARSGTLGAPQNSTDRSRIVWTAPECVTATNPASVTFTVTNSYDLTATRTIEPTGLPVCSSWTPTGSMRYVHSSHTATLLSNGKVLVAGSVAQDGAATAEVYDPATGTWALTGSMMTPRSQHTATLLSNGKVLVAGGYAYDRNRVVA